MKRNYERGKSFGRRSFLDILAKLPWNGKSLKIQKILTYFCVSPWMIMCSFGGFFLSLLRFIWF